MPPYYPINDFGPAMKGMVIGTLGVVHVFLAMFAIGGGMLMCYFQWLAQTGRCHHARPFVDGYFRVLVLISFVVGAVTGVAMWFVSIQVSPRTIGMMVHEFHWVWAIEWTFFSLEITSGYCFYRYAKRLDDHARLTLLAIYSVAAWFSLFWINGILSWQLTPGDWTESHRVWTGFFNAGFFPSLMFRTVTAMTVGSLVACIVINGMSGLDRAARTELINRAAHFLLPMALMPLLGIWYFGTMPADSRQMVTGGSVVMTMFMGLAIGASVLIGLYAFFGLWLRHLYINGATATLLCALSFVATGGGEFVREGVRKPYTVRENLYSNSIKPDEVARLREVGCVTNDPYPLQDADQYPSDQLRLGARVFRFHCSVCHTMEGANALIHLAGSWTDGQKRMNIAQLQRTKTFMPPFAGTPEELEALVQLISWHTAGKPDQWPQSRDAATLRQIQAWLDEVGTAPGYELAHVPWGRASSLSSNQVRAGSLYPRSTEGR
jgi:cytochrome bd-type quinol oxidase subunit 1/mono/diheme cytochrome c family protein